MVSLTSIISSYFRHITCLIVNMAQVRSEEREPLLQNDHSTNSGSQYGQFTPENNTEPATIVSPVGPDELPPPYTQSPDGGVPMVSCRVCQSMIDITGKQDQHVVKCNHCGEATPIKNAPPGKKYVRCPCNCLLICKGTSQKIACPRPNCKRIINLAPSPVATASPSVPGMCRVTCAYCHDTFLFNTLNNALARCPHCRKLSSVGPAFAKSRALIFLILGLVFLSLGIGLTVGTHKYARSAPGIYTAYVAAFLAAVVFLLRSMYYATMKVSIIESPA